LPRWLVTSRLALSESQAYIFTRSSDGAMARPWRGLQEGHVWPTLEIIVTESPAHLCEAMDEESGLGLISARSKRDHCFAALRC
jgi:hypothetical protein